MDLKKKKKKLIILVIINFPIMFLVYVITSIKCSIIAAKPIIYIYPEQEMKVEVSLSNPNDLLVSYPKYNNTWKVTAKEDGTLMDSNNKKYYALYYESKKDIKNSMKEDGFIVKKEDTISFLEEKLEILGLNYKEKNEFIMYWLPILEQNKYNYIRFQTMEEINQIMELNINPKPDTLIRIMMEYKPLKKEIKVKEQTLTPVERVGYIVVEWGGTKIN